jgi:hypothetical protein
MMAIGFKSIVVKHRNVAVLALAAMMLTGLSYSVPARQAFAHNFSHSETTEFLAAVEMTKAYLDLARTNLQDREMAQGFAHQATMFLDEHWMSEIAERNQRIADDLSTSLEQLPFAIGEGQSATQIREEVRNIKGLLAEAISVRIDRVELQDSKTQALVMAKVLSEAMFRHQVSQGVDEELAYELAYGIKKMSEMGDGMGMMNNSNIDEAQHKASKALASKSFYISTKVKKADSTDPALVDAAKMGLRQVKSGIDHAESWQDVIGIMHQGVHENLRVGFDLQMQMQTQMMQ